MTLQPLDDYVIIKEHKLEEVIKSSLVLSENVNMDRPVIATVISVGPKVTKVKGGESVLFLYHLFTDILVDKEQFKIGKEEGIIGIYAD